MHRNKKTGRLFLRTSIHGTGRHFTQQLNTAGEQRLLKAGVDVGHRLPGWLLEKLEEHHEVHPCLGIFGGQRSLDLDEKVTAVRRSRRVHRAHPSLPSDGTSQQQRLVLLQLLPSPPLSDCQDLWNRLEPKARRRTQ